MHVLSSIATIAITLTPQVVAIIVVALILLLVLLRIASNRRRRGIRRTRRPGAPQASRTSTRRRDHGQEIARRHGHERSPEWHRVEKEHLLHEPACVVCGHRGKGLQVHHIKPFHLHPNLELDPRNLITLCELKGRDHHLLIGHLDEWESYNVNVKEDAHHYHGKTSLQIRSDTAWQKAVARRP